MSDEAIGSWLIKFKLKAEDKILVEQELGLYVDSVEGFEDLERENIDALEAFIEGFEGIVIGKKNKLKNAIRSAWQPNNFGAPSSPQVTEAKMEGISQQVQGQNSRGSVSVEQQEQLNFLRFATILIDEVSKTLRKLFIYKWNKTYPKDQWETSSSKAKQTSGVLCWEGSKLDVDSGIQVQCIENDKNLQSTTKIEEGRLPSKEKVQLSSQTDPSEVISISAHNGTTKITLNKFAPFEGEATVLTQRIRHETKATNQMKRPFARKVKSGETDEWDISLLVFLLCNSSHKLLSDAMEDQECLGLLCELRNLRNVGFGHTSECRLRDEELERRIEIIRNFAKSALVLKVESDGGPSLTARIKRMMSSGEPLREHGVVDSQRWESALQNWDMHFVELFDKVGAVDERLEEHAGRSEANDGVTHALLQTIIESLKQQQRPKKDGQELRKVLAPLSTEFIGRMLLLTTAFCPGTREWVFQRVQEWRQEPNPRSNVFVITANMGIGKSCIAAVLTQVEKDFIWGYFFCKHDSRNWRDPKRLVMTWAHQLSEKLPEYKELLVELLEGQETKQSLLDQSVHDLFTMLLSAPLCQLQSPPTEPVALLVDALDECEHRGRNELLSFIRRRWDELPKWLRLIATSRPSGGSDEVNDILKQLKKFSPIMLAADDKSNLRDIEIFARELLKGRVADAGREDEAVALLVEKTQGAFLYLQYARETHLSDHNPQEMGADESTKLTMEQLAQMPEGLEELYRDEFERLEKLIVQKIESKEERLQLKGVMQQCLEVVVAAQEPVPMEVVAEILGCGEDTAEEVLGVLALFFPERNGCVMVWHKSLCDYLTNKKRKGKKYWVDEQAGHRIMSDAAVKAVKGVKEAVVGRRKMLLQTRVRLRVLHGEVKQKELERFRVLEQYRVELEQQLAEVTQKEPEQQRVVMEQMRTKLTALQLLKGEYELQRLNDEHELRLKDEQVVGGQWERYCLKYAVYHLRHDGDERVGARVRELACDLRYVESKAQAGMVFELAREYKGEEESRVKVKGGSSREGNSQGGAERDEDMHSFYRFALEHSSFLDERPHATRQCAINWPDGLLPTAQASALLSHIRPPLPPTLDHPTPSTAGQSIYLKMQRKPTALGGYSRVAVHHTGAGVNSVHFSADTRQMVSGGNEGNVMLWDVQSGEELACMAHGDGNAKSCSHEDIVTSVCFSTDGRQVVSGGHDGSVKLWDAISGEEQRCMLHGADINSVCFSADGRQVVSGGQDGNMKLWNAASGEEQACMAHSTRDLAALCTCYSEGVCTCGTAGVASVCFSADGRQVVSGGQDGNVKLWDAASGEEQRCMAHGDSGIGRVVGGEGVASLSFSADGRQVASGGNDGNVKLWGVQSGEEQGCMAHGGCVVVSVCFSADGRQVVSGGNEGNVKLWDVASGEELGCMAHGIDWSISLSFSVDGWHLVTGGLKDVKLWDVIFGEDRQACIAHGNEGVTSVSFSADGRRVVSGGQDGNVKLWDAASGEEQRCMAHGNEGAILLQVTSVCFSADGRQVASGGQDGNVKLWDVASGEELACMAHGCGVDSYVSPIKTTPYDMLNIGWSAMINSVCFSPDGRQVVSGGKDMVSGGKGGYVRNAKLWDVASGEELGCMVHGREIRGMCAWFSADGRQVVSGGNDGSVKLWDAVSGEEQRCMLHGADIKSVCFSADGRQDAMGVLTDGPRLTRRQYGAYHLIVCGDELQLLRETASCKIEVGCIKLMDDIVEAGFISSGAIFVALRTRVPLVLEVWEEP
jgi:WD40 repeat protein